MTIRERRRLSTSREAMGFHEGAHPKISVRFEQATFERIKHFARMSNNCSFNDAVRLLVGYAFDQLDRESEADDGERARAIDAGAAAERDPAGLLAQHGDDYPRDIRRDAGQHKTVAAGDARDHDDDENSSKP